MNTDQLVISQLLKKKKKRKAQRRQIFKKILSKCHLRIKSAALNEHTSCSFKIPELVLGYPIYNVFECKKFIIKMLIENGFKVNKIEESDVSNDDKYSILISWSHHE